MTDVDTSARQLVSDLIESHHPKYGFGSMTCAVYDTAWLSMIRKPVNGTWKWLFPSSFDLLLNLQKQDGGWDSHAVETDGILNTAAALLALCLHHDATSPGVLASRIERASRCLRERLQVLDVSSILPVAFEMILPALLDLLSREGISVDFPARQTLMEFRDKKMARVDLKSIYNGAKSTVLHSLEAFIGKIDFDRLGQHKALGSMMCSPASTAAYLMYASTWDDESEEYLRHVVEFGAGKGDGSVPSAFPSTNFEFTWVVSTLLENGFNSVDLGTGNLITIKNILEDAFASGSGLIGFAPSLEPDADDTAKGITTLNLLGVPSSGTRLIEEYSNGEHFKTYKFERDASLTTNCNALSTLCLSPDAGQHCFEIEMAMKFLRKMWWQDSKWIRDKWSTSPYYPIMLMTQSLKRAVDLWARGSLQNLSREVLQDVLVVIFQALVRVLRSQGADGSWDGKRETTAYAVITLNAVASWLIVQPLNRQIELAIENGRVFLSRDMDSDSPPEHLWIEKITYGSRNLSRAFTLAALKCSPKSSPAPLQEIIPEPLDAVLKPAKFFRQLPLFSTTPDWCIVASLIEGSLFKTRLRDKCLQIFPERTSSKEKHLSFIPFTWTAGNNMNDGALGSDIMLEMMVISALAYQLDEFIESEVATLPVEAVTELKCSIGRIFMEIEEEAIKEKLLSDSKDQKANGGILFAKADIPVITLNDVEVSPASKKQRLNRHISSQTQLSNHSPNRTKDAITTDDNALNQLSQRHDIVHAQQAFKRFIRYLWQAPYMQVTAEYNKAQLKFTIQDFLIAHLTQTEDSRRLAAQQLPEQGKNKIFAYPRSSLHKWTHTTSGDHTAGPFAVAAFFCMLGQGKDLMPSPQSKYIAQNMSRHLAALCRLYNDFGSMARDRAENNLNSVNFAEFSEAGDEPTLKEKLFAIAEYERRCLNASMAELRPLVDEKVFTALSIFCNSADMYGQMYVIKDLTPAFKQQTASGSRDGARDTKRKHDICTK